MALGFSPYSLEPRRGGLRQNTVYYLAALAVWPAQHLLHYCMLTLRCATSAEEAAQKDEAALPRDPAPLELVHEPRI